MIQTELKKIEYPSPYERLVWDYKNANLKAINKDIEGFNWEESFRGKDIDAQAYLFNKTVTNICPNYIPNKYATFNDKDPPWLNDHIRLLIKKKNVVFQKYLKDGKTGVNYTNLQTNKAELTNAINLSKKHIF